MCVCVDIQLPNLVPKINMRMKLDPQIIAFRQKLLIYVYKEVGRSAYNFKLQISLIKAQKFDMLTHSLIDSQIIIEHIINLTNN